MAAEVTGGGRRYTPRSTREPAPEPPLETEYRPHEPLDLVGTVAFLDGGTMDPTAAIVGGVLWRSTRTPDGPATIALRRTAAGVVRAAAWGAGAAWTLDQVPALCGAQDDRDGFDASLHPLVAAAHHRNPGLRLGRTDLVFDALVAAVLGQKVTAGQALGAWRSLVRRYGERAPGPTPVPLYVPPSIDGWRRIPSWAWHRAGVEPPQSKAIVRAASVGDALVAAVTAAPADDRDRALVAQPGIGAWTAAETRIRAFGDPDAVSVGDYHLAHHVGFALTGARTDDDGMLELLEPWRGQRQRVIRLLVASGVTEPRRGPRVHAENHRAR